MHNYESLDKRANYYEIARRKVSIMQFINNDASEASNIKAQNITDIDNKSIHYGQYIKVYIREHIQSKQNVFGLSQNNKKKNIV